MASNAPPQSDEPRDADAVTERLSRIAQDLDTQEAVIQDHLRKIDEREDVLCRKTREHIAADEEAEIAVGGDAGSDGTYHTIDTTDSEIPATQPRRSHSLAREPRSQFIRRQVQNPSPI